jgi:signal transduction histidine kinase/ligand-binding sensor domain-containing protein
LLYISPAAGFSVAPHFSRQMIFMLPASSLCQCGFRVGIKLARHTLLIICILFLCGASSTVIAQYRFDVLNTDTGLPQNSVLAILQTHDGYLWFTTLDGLVRYDGVRYTVFNKANSKGINSNRFRSLYEDTDGTLWISTEDGGLTHYQNGQFRTYTTADGLPRSSVTRVRRTSEGKLLVLTDGGLTRMQGDRFEIISSDTKSFDSDIGIQGQSGSTWYRVNTELRRVKDGKVTAYAVPRGGRDMLFFNQLYEDQQGRLWIGTHLNPNGDGELWALKDERMTRYSVRDGLPHAFVTSFCEDHEGAMWFGTNGAGLVRFKDGRFTTYTTTQGLASNTVEAIFEDREHTLWVGTRDNGITRITRQVITALSEKDGLKGKVFYPIIEGRDGSVWIGNEGVNRFKDGKFTYYPLDLTPQYAFYHQPSALVQAFYQDRDDHLWIGHSYGLYRFENEQFTNDERMSNRESPYAIFQDSTGAFWFGYHQRLTRYQNGEVKEFTTKDGLQDLVQPIYEDRQGRIWIGSYGGLAEYVDGHLVLLTEKDGLSSNRVRAIYEDREGVLWIGTYDGGLNRFKDGKFVSFTTSEGMFSNGVFAILEDQRGNFWMSSNQGIYRVRRQQLNDFADGKVSKIDAVSYGKADGMLNTECNGARHPSAIKTHDGKMWFPTFNGIAVVDPQAVTFNDTPPPVVIEQVILDGESLDIGKAIEVRPGQNNLEIHYTGLSFVKPEHIKFKYKLEGLDEEWIDAGNRRTAYFPRLPAGDYVFRVIAANADGVWNETGATMRVTVIPPFWQRLWFITLVVISIVAIAAILVRARVKKLERAKAAQEDFSRQLIASQEQERKRIAAELHDSLGQNLMVIKNWVQMARHALEPESRAGEPLAEVAVVVSHSIEEVREIAYNLRPYHLDEIGLTAAIHSMLDRIADSSGIGFAVEIDTIDGLLTSESEIHFYRVIQESINNIVKHAEATAAEVSIRRDSQTLKVVIKDNGKGFELEEVMKNKDHGFGLTGISERVRLLGGRETMQSAQGAGTQIMITLDLKETRHADPDPHSDR